MASTSENTFLQHALWYHSLGWSVIPLQPKGKEPLWQWKAYQRRRLTPEEIKKWWSIHPDANVGIVTGAISGLVVVDVDSIEDVLSLFPGGIPAPDGVLQVSTGKGYHFYYAHPGGHVTTRPGIGGIKGLDIKGDGGYVVAPPSVHPSGKVYEWVIPRGETNELVIPRGENLPPLPTFYLSILRGGSKGEADTALLDIIRSGVPEGMRNDSAARVVGFYLWLGLSPEETWEQVWAWNQRNSPPLSDEELRQVYDSICNREEQHQTTREGRISSQAKRLVELAHQRIELFATPGGVYGEPHASFPVELEGRVHLETAPLNSQQFKAWLRREYYRTTGQTVGEHALQDAIGTLVSDARYLGKVREVSLRVAWHGGNIYIDIGDPHWRQLEVTPEGWKVIESTKSPVRFRRTSGMLPLPIPQQGGDFQLLRKYTNTPEEEQWALLQGFILGCYLPPDKPHLILVISGEQGSAKSTLTKIIRKVVDPNVVPLRRPPQSERDLLVAAYNSWLLTMDNASSISGWLSDGISALATGGGYATRMLFSDLREVVQWGSRPIIINGIGELLTKHDLMDRAIVLSLPHILDSARRTEWEIEEEFKQDYPLILGGILDTLVEGLRQLPSTQIPNLPRMADSAQWAIACGVVGFEEAYRENKRETLSAALETDVVWQRVEEFMSQHPNGWKGTPTELHQNLLLVGGRTIYDTPAKFPSTPNVLSTHLKGIAPAMRQKGIKVTFEREGKGNTRRRVISLTRTKEGQDT